MTGDAVERLIQAVGDGAVRSVTDRGLLWRIEGPSRSTASATRRADRLAGLFAGLAAGGADETGVIGLDVQSFTLSASSWLDHGWWAPAALAEQLSRELHMLRLRGEAVARAVEAYRAGAPWYLAGTPSHGHAALGRALAAGVVFARDPSAAGVAGSVDAVVTHAEPTATAASAALAAIVAGLIGRPDGVEAADIVAALVPVTLEPRVRGALRRAHATVVDGGASLQGRRWTVRADDTLELAVASALSTPGPAAALDLVRRHAGDSQTAGAVAAALAGAIHGGSVVPLAWHAEFEDADARRALLARVVEHDAAGADEPAGSDIWFLVDRSGSMQTIADDVVIGFDRFFAGQREAGGDAAVTIVEFDDEDPHDVLVDAAPLHTVPSLAGRFAPRGMTPLYDAIALLLDRAERHGGDDGDQLVVVLTDGDENASRLWTQRALFSRIDSLRERGWTFVFLGANQDSYASGAAVGFQAGNVSNFEASPMGVHAVYDGLGRTVTDWRGKGREARRRDRDDFWSGRKEAEGLGEE